MPHFCWTYTPDVLENEIIVDVIFVLPTNIEPITPQNLNVDSTGRFLSVSFNWDDKFCNACNRYSEIYGWGDREVPRQAAIRASLTANRTGFLRITLPCTVTSEIRRFIRFDDTIYGAQLVNLEFQTRKKLYTMEIISSDNRLSK